MSPKQKNWDSKVPSNHSVVGVGIFIWTQSSLNLWAPGSTVKFHGFRVPGTGLPLWYPVLTTEGNGATPGTPYNETSCVKHRCTTTDPCNPVSFSQKNIPAYYPTVLVIVQKARETSTNIPRYCTFGYCTVPCARSSCFTCSFLSSY